eukprot:s12781_g1.t1
MRTSTDTRTPAVMCAVTSTWLQASRWAASTSWRSSGTTPTPWTVRTPKTERHPKLLQLLYSLMQEEPEKSFQRLFLFYDRAAEDSELPAVAEDWD